MVGGGTDAGAVSPGLHKIRRAALQEGRIGRELAGRASSG